jgi:hypothetical protein
VLISVSGCLLAAAFDLAFDLAGCACRLLSLPLLLSMQCRLLLLHLLLLRMLWWLPALHLLYCCSSPREPWAPGLCSTCRAATRLGAPPAWPPGWRRAG